MSRHLDEETINLFLDGMLDEPARERADIHLAVCADCRAELARWHEMFVALDALAPATATEDASFTRVALARINPTPGQRFWPWLAAQGAMAIGLLLWGWPYVAAWAGKAQTWLAAQSTGLGDWLGRLVGSVAGWAGWLGAGLVSLARELDLTLSANGSLLQWGLVTGLWLVVWLLGNRLLLRGDSSTSFGFAQDRLLRSLGMTYHKGPE